MSARIILLLVGLAAAVPLWVLIFLGFGDGGVIVLASIVVIGLEAIATHVNYGHATPPYENKEPWWR